MRNLLRAGALALAICAAGVSLAGCGASTTLKNIYDAATGATVNTTTVYVGANSIDAIEVTATNYLKRPKCTGSNGPLCRSATATVALIPAVRSARDARKAVVQYSIDHPGQLGSQGLYDAMKAAYSTVQDVITNYGIK